MDAITHLELDTESRAQLTALAKETKEMGHDHIADDLAALATVEPPVVSNLLRELLEGNIPVDLGSSLRQLVDVVRDVRGIVAKSSVSEQAA